MNSLRRLLLITFIESFATILVERAVYFFCKYRLGFSDADNLWVALVFGVVYVGGAMCSHAISRRAGEKRLLYAMLYAQLATHAALALWATPVTIFVGASALGCLNGLKWPVIESYISAGRLPVDTARAIGRFNMSWSVAVPLSLLAAGPIIEWQPAGIFILAGALNAAAMVLCLPLTPRPSHLSADHPERYAGADLARCRTLLTASRWLMLGSYSLMWVLAAIMPEIFRSMGFAVAEATSVSSVMDVCRMLTFALLTFWGAWRMRTWPLLASMIGQPLGFFLVCYGGNVWLVLGGEVLFGTAAGLTYFAALYYAMIVKNASVEAGGGHEGLIGLGFALGPAAALAGGQFASGMNGTSWGVMPILAVTLAAAAWVIARRR